MIKKYLESVSVCSPHRALSYRTGPDIVDERILVGATRGLAINTSSGLLLLLLVLPPHLGRCSIPPVSPLEDTVAGAGG